MSWVNRVFQCRKVRCDVYIGRGKGGRVAEMRDEKGYWGNPIPLSQDTDRGRKECLIQYWDWLNNTEEGMQRLADVQMLAGKTLGCFCSPKLCHGHVLDRLANDADGWNYCNNTINRFRKEVAS